MIQSNSTLVPQIKRLAVEWLKTKKNYVYYEDNNAYNAFVTSFYNMVKTYRIAPENIIASSMYIIQKSKSDLNIDFEESTHHKNTYNSFNIPRNEFVFNIAQIFHYAKIYQISNVEQKETIVFVILKELLHMSKINNKFIQEKNDSIYKEIFNELLTNAEEAFNTITDEIKNNKFDYKDFQSRYIDRITYRARSFQEIGIFYPFKYDHDIFEKKHYAFEINFLKFKRKDVTLRSKIKKYYETFRPYFDKNKDYVTPEEYMIHPGKEFNKKFAYLDPFMLIKKYESEHKYLIKSIEDKKLNANLFIFDFFEFLNNVQYTTVKFQHENLIDMIRARRTKNRLFSMDELIDHRLKNPSLDPVTKKILVQFKEKLNSKEYTKDTEIDDLGFADDSDDIKSLAESVLSDMKEILKGADLNYILYYYKKKSKALIKKYKINPDGKEYIYEIIRGIIVFYKDQEHKTFSKRINRTLYEIYFKHQKDDIGKNVNFDVKFEDSFICENIDLFDKHNF